MEVVYQHASWMVDVRRETSAVDTISCYWRWVGLDIDGDCPSIKLYETFEGWCGFASISSVR